MKLSVPGPRSARAEIEKMKIPESIRDAVPILANNLSEKLLMVLMDDAFACALTLKSPITLEIFLAVLYRSFPNQVAGFFFQSEGLEKMARELCPTNPEKARAPSPERYPTPRFIMTLKIEDRLAYMLLQAAQFASSSGRGRADISEFIGVLSLDDETLKRLHRERNLILKGYLGSLS